MILGTSLVETPSSEEQPLQDSVKVKYLSEGVTSTKEESVKLSRSSTEEWEKMGDSNSEPIGPKEGDNKSSTSEEDWVKCE